MDTETLLDRIDRKILRVLQAEGRITNQALAERVALSPSACLSRVRRLEQAGVIQGYHARLDPFRLGIGLVLYVEVTLEGRDAGEQKRFEAAIAEMPQVVEASHVSGDVDYLLKVVVPGMADWTRLRDRFANDIPIRRITTHILMSKPRIFTGYPIPESAGPKASAGRAST